MPPTLYRSLLDLILVLSGRSRPSRGGFIVRRQS